MNTESNLNKNMNVKPFFKEVFTEYSKLEFPVNYQELSQLDRLVWYLSDETNSKISVIDQSYDMTIWELDIQSAFPTICRNLFDQDSEFIIGLDKISDKKARNIYIATTLKDTGVIEQLNTISKMAIFGLVFSIDRGADLLELKKDGITFISYNPNLSLLESSQQSEFANFLLSKGFHFHSDKFKKYIRHSRTSYVVKENDQISIKGIYKHIPKFISSQVEKILTHSECSEDVMDWVYSTKYWKACIINNLDELLTQYYLCDNSKYLDQYGKYRDLSDVRKNINIVNPRRYLQTWIYPLITSFR